MIPTETPRHLQEAAAKELARLLKAGCLEPVHHPTSTCSRAFFVQKNKKDGTIEAILVTDFLRKLTGAPKNLGVVPFPVPVGHFGAPWRPFWIFEFLIDGIIKSKNLFCES